MKKVYLYKRFERFWHWSQVLLIAVLLVTGFEIHSSFDILGYETAVKWHNYAAWSFIILVVFAVFWHFSTDEWQNYIPTTKNLKAQINYYIFGIFKDAPHPTKKRTLSKLNPLQKLIYLGLNIIVVPVMLGTGLVYFYFHYPIGGLEVQSIKPIALIHTFGAYILVVFIVIHVYLITTGHTLSSNLMAMITGWDKMDDKDTKDIIEDAIDEVGQQIIASNEPDLQKGKEVKEIIAEALEEIGEKIGKDEMKGQKILKKKKNGKK